jgi:hypothetical protein
MTPDVATDRHNPADQKCVHSTPGVYRPGDVRPDEHRVVIAPSLAGHAITATDPLTITPSILCLGSAYGCGLHGFVQAGTWVDAGTPPETMAHIRGEVAP